MPGPRIEPRTTKYKADVVTGHRDEHYANALPTAIMMNKTRMETSTRWLASYWESPMSMLLDISNNTWVGSITFTIMIGNAYAGSDQSDPCCYSSSISV